MTSLHADLLVTTVALCAFGVLALMADMRAKHVARQGATAEATATDEQRAQPRPDPCHMLKPADLPTSLPQVRSIGPGPPPGGWRYSNNFVECGSATGSFRPDGH